MSLRAKLLLLSLLTLILPWAGWQYAQRMETTLRSGQEQSLMRTAEVLARVVASQPELLYRSPEELREDFDPAHGDYFAPLLTSTPLLDGFADEWPVPTRTVAGVDVNGSAPRLGVFERFMYVYFEAPDAHIRYENPASDNDPSASRAVFLTRDEFGRERAWSISAVAPGPLIARPTEVGAPWQTSQERNEHITGVWRATATGYAIELRAPLSMFGQQLAVFALDDQGNTTRPPVLGKLHTASGALRERLEQYAPNGLRVSVVDPRGWLLARAGSVATTASDYSGLQRDENGFVRSIYRRLFGRDTTPVSYGIPYGMWGAPVDAARAGRTEAIWFEPVSGEPSLVRAAVPVQLEERTLAALVVEQPAEQLAIVREEALTRLLNLTLLATLFSIAVTLAFAARLSHRIRRLSRAVGSALTPEGRLEPRIPETKSRDELGALARNYSTLLSRLKEHTHYLQTLGTKLSHELRTPLTIVSSSLDNLASEDTLPAASQDYLERARSGTGRLHAILTAMSEATRVEQIIEHTERTQFDLAELVRNIGNAYAATFTHVQMETRAPERRCLLNGSADLIAQLLDKLMDNAASFSPSGGRVVLQLESEVVEYRLTVSNEGPLLPPQLDGRLFESLVSARARPDTRPHLGLGLYIVRLIAEFHSGHAVAANLADDSGVAVTVILPITLAT